MSGTTSDTDSEGDLDLDLKKVKIVSDEPEESSLKIRGAGKQSSYQSYIFHTMPLSCGNIRTCADASAALPKIYSDVVISCFWMNRL